MSIPSRGRGHHAALLVPFLLFVVGCRDELTTPTTPSDTPPPVEDTDNLTGTDTDTGAETDTDPPPVIDADLDGYSPPEDCDDNDPSVHPDAPEVCNGIDDNCLNGADDGLLFQTWYADADGDGYGDAADGGMSSCDDLSASHVLDATDCDDADPSVHADAVELCNAIDDDCANGADDGLLFQTWYADADDDGYGDPLADEWSCSDLSATKVLDGTDCDDSDASLNHDDADLDGVDTCGLDCNDAHTNVFPGAPEVCNGIDDNCLNGADDGLLFQTWYVDADDDGYGDGASGDLSCEDRSATEILDGTDCDDGDASLNHDDADFDGVDTCGLDCNDANAKVFPGAPEVCNGIDDNCVKGADDGLMFQTWYADADDDGYGDPLTDESSCEDLSATKVLDGTDCDDSDASLNHDDADSDGVDTCGLDCNDANAKVFPGAPEVCNAVDDDCDAGIDENFRFTNWYVDADQDGYGDPETLLATCLDMSDTHVTDDTDCLDTDAALNHDDLDGDGVDTCDGDCDDTTSKITLPTAWLHDLDMDGFGSDLEDPLLSCLDPGPDYVPDSDELDCDDADPAVSPGAREVCGNGLDDDCLDGDAVCAPVYVGSFFVDDGIEAKLDPPVLSCLDACAQLFGGVAVDYDCSTSDVFVDNSAFVSGWGDATFCTLPVAQDFKQEDPQNPGYDCKKFGCSYSAYVDDVCDPKVENYCWLR